jgi:hypothetical protein
MNQEPAPPPPRKAVAILLLVVGLLVYAILAVTLIDLLPWSDAAKIPLFAIAGILWIFPCRNLMIWMETGRWRLPKDGK